MLHKYHLVLKDGKERDIRAAEALLEDGALVFRDSGGEPCLAYAPGTWNYAELERKDDEE